jgi:hypothetical protein
MNELAEYVYYSDRRINFLERNGYPGPLSSSTAFPVYFNNIFVNKDGYWAYLFSESRNVLLPSIVCLVGDPICPPDKMQFFIMEAIEQLKSKGTIIALQVHGRCARFLENLKQTHFASHQFGMETQVRIPYPLNGQIGNKVRQSIKEGLQVEELIWKSDQSDAPAIDIWIKQDITSVKKIKTGINTEELDNSLKSKNVISTGQSIYFDKLIHFLDSSLNNSDEPNLAEFRRKLERFKDGSLPKDIIIFTEENAESLISFGYYQPKIIGFNEHRFQIESKSKNSRYPLLKSGKKLIDDQDIFELEKVSKAWLSQKLNPREMGPPFLKPFNRNYEPGRRLFVARDHKERIIAFVDFDLTNWVNPDGSVNKSKIGYYANMIRNMSLRNPNGRESYKNVRYLLLGAAAQRFADEGYSLLNLGLNPFAMIDRDNHISKNEHIKNISFIEMFLAWVSRSPIMNETTFAYGNVIKTKQQNWKNTENVMTYLVFEGNFVQQIFSLFHVFKIGGAIGNHVLSNLKGYGLRRIRDLACVTKR